MNHNDKNRLLNMAGDGLGLNPAEYAALLSALTVRRQPEPDYYCAGGVVDSFEQKMARLLGKEDALIMPSGTMANLLALEYHAGHGSRVVVQHDSHIHLDCGDAAQSLGGLNLIPMSPGRMPKVGDIAEALAMHPIDKVDVPINVLHLESPVRRLHEAAFDLDEFHRLIAHGRSAGMKLHLDGARLFIWSAWCGKSPKELAAGFDTVYVSLYKYFNTLFGAILAGPSEMIERLRHRRRRNGGALARIWPVALVADHFSNGFMERLIAAKEASSSILQGLDSLPNISVKPVEQGTNASLLKWAGANKLQADKLRFILSKHGIILPKFSAKDEGFWIKVNETWFDFRTDSVISAFESAFVDV